MSTLGNKLRQLSSDDSLYIPEEQENDSPQIKHKSNNDDILDISSGTKNKKSEKKNKKKKKSSLDSFDGMEDYFSDVGLSDEELSDTFDGIIDILSDEDDEDTELRTSLLSMGRKYARETQSSELSEVQKAFSGNDKKINRLLTEVRADKDRLTKYIQSLSPRASGPKSIAELQDTLNGIHAAELNIIKESNNMIKSEIELQIKAKASKKDEQGTNELSGNMISSLFGMDRKNVMGNIGGYAGISGAIDKKDNDEDEEELSNTEEVYEEVSTDDEDEEENSDGDKFLKYRDRGVEYILEIDGNGNKNIYAEDKDGNIIDDYPMPSNQEELSFEIDDKDNTAQDDYFRKYKIRRV